MHVFLVLDAITGANSPSRKKVPASVVVPKMTHENPAFIYDAISNGCESIITMKH